MNDTIGTYDPEKPFLIEDPFDYLDSNSLNFYKDVNIIDSFLFFPGDPVEEKDYQLVFEINMREEKLLALDIVPTCFPGVIANKKVVDILTRFCPDDFQVFPVTIKRERGKRKSKEFVNHDYYLIHIIRKIESMDLESSEFSLLDVSKPKKPGNICAPRKLRFKPCMPGLNIARDSILPSVTFISQKLFSIFHAVGIKGAEFVPDFLSFYERSNYPELFRDREGH